MRKYLAHGLEVEVIQKLDGEKGWVVLEILQEPESGDEYKGEIRIVDKIFDAPVTNKLDERITTLQAKVSDLETQKRELERSISEATASSSAILLRCKQHAQLKLLEDYIDGKITHYVSVGYWMPNIIKFSDTNQKEHYEHRDEFKLLTLFGCSKGDLQWRLNHYYDGSGPNSQVFLATSEEEAIAIARRVVTEKLEATKDRPDEQCVTAAKKFGVEVPSTYLSLLIQNKEKNLAERISKTAQEFSLEKDKIEILKAT